MSGYGEFVCSPDAEHINSHKLRGHNNCVATVPRDRVDRLQPLYGSTIPIEVGAIAAHI
ncbi:hypothetical protein ACPOL_6187 [Acidisarcina polymorpha]|uniref:Uncharacterized protein n=1 Tax=Acidisarcina polymorpha TaxID=2211140 RepID=A0A2Z5G8M3_9BACT|nr:hypothetical protein ACPOL_6187 [Acidisarcina polymorpha]